MTDGPTPEQMAWDGWHRRNRAHVAIGMWVFLMFGTLAKTFVDGVLPYLRLRASSADSNALLASGLEAAKAAGLMLIILVVAGVIALILARSLQRRNDLLGERPADRDENLDAGR